MEREFPVKCSCCLFGVPPRDQKGMLSTQSLHEFLEQTAESCALESEMRINNSNTILAIGNLGPNVKVNRLVCMDAAFKGELSLGLGCFHRPVLNQ
jgi:hypothetical protein